MEASSRTGAIECQPPEAGLSAPNRPAWGIFWMSTAAFGSSSMNGLVRATSADLHAFEIAFFRNVFGLMALVPMILENGVALTLRTSRLGLHVLRGALNAVAMLAFFYAVTITPLATVAALGFTAPLFAAVLAIPILGERPGWRRWVALVAGFLGALLIIRPGLADISFGALMVLFSSSAWACALIIIKILARTDTSLTTTVFAALFLTPVTFVAALFVWTWPGSSSWLLLVAIGGFGSLTQWSIAQAFHEADTTVVLPFDFTKLLWASVIGYVAFGEIPDPLDLIGGAVILGSITYVAYRERVTQAD